MAGPPRYPVMLDLAGRPCLVVGGGRVAGRKVAGLRESGALVTVVAPTLAADLEEARSRGELEWVEGAVGVDDPLLPGRWALVVAATDDAGLNRAVVAACEQAGTWAVDASSPTGGPASVPAVHRQGAVTVAVSTAGASPAAAAWLRDQLGAAIDPAVVVMIELLAEVEAERAAQPGDSTARDRAGAAAVSGHTGPRAGRSDWQRLLDSGTLDEIRHGRVARAKERLKACLSSSSD